jgi:two-component system response regulator TctD
MSRRVLVIDDDPHLGAALAILLGRAGHAVELASDGRAGLVSARDAKPGLILLDTGLPGTSGWYTLARLRELASLAGTPVIVMVSAADPPTRALAAGLGADDCLAKPFGPADALARVQRAMAATTGHA